MYRSFTQLQVRFLTAFRYEANDVQVFIGRNSESTAWNPESKNVLFPYMGRFRGLRVQNPGRQEIIFCKTLAVKGLNIPQGYPQFITESLKEEQKEHS